MRTYVVDVPLNAYIQIEVEAPDDAYRMDILHAMTRDHLHDAWCEGDGYPEKLSWDAHQVIKDTYASITLDNFYFYEAEADDED